MGCGASKAPPANDPVEPTLQPAKVIDEPKVDKPVEAAPPLQAPTPKAASVESAKPAEKAPPPYEAPKPAAPEPVQPYSAVPTPVKKVAVPPVKAAAPAAPVAPAAVSKAASAPDSNEVVVVSITINDEPDAECFVTLKLVNAEDAAAAPAKPSEDVAVNITVNEEPKAQAYASLSLGTDDPPKSQPKLEIEPAPTAPTEPTPTGGEDQDAAAAKLQATYRGAQDRKSVSAMKADVQGVSAKIDISIADDGSVSLNLS